MQACTYDGSNEDPTGDYLLTYFKRNLVGVNRDLIVSTNILSVTCTAHPALHTPTAHTWPLFNAANYPPTLISTQPTGILVSFDRQQALFLIDRRCPLTYNALCIPHFQIVSLFLSLSLTNTLSLVLSHSLSPTLSQSNPYLLTGRLIDTR